MWNNEMRRGRFRSQNPHTRKGSREGKGLFIFSQLHSPTTHIQSGDWAFFIAFNETRMGPWALPARSERAIRRTGSGQPAGMRSPPSLLVSHRCEYPLLLRVCVHVCGFTHGCLSTSVLMSLWATCNNVDARSLPCLRLRNDSLQSLVTTQVPLLRYSPPAKS